MGFDFGTRKIGVAVGQTVTGTASSLAVLKARQGKPDWPELEQLVSQWKPSAFVIGMPFNMDGSENEMTALTKNFISSLNKHFNIPCHEIDERLSTREARDIVRANAEESGRRYDNHTQVDGLVAQLLLESWLTENTL